MKIKVVNYKFKSIKNLQIFLFYFILVSNLNLAFAGGFKQNNNLIIKSLLNYEIEGVKSTQDMSYVAGFLHALVYMQNNTPVHSMFFCKETNLTFNDLLKITNAKLKGEVTAEQVDKVIIDGLTEKYPCSNKQGHALLKKN